MLRKSLIGIALLAASAGVMADSGPRVYGSVVIADPNFSVAIGSGYPYVGPYYWAPPVVGPYYYGPKHYYKHPHRYYYPTRYYHNSHHWKYREEYRHGGRGYPPHGGDGWDGPPRHGGGYPPHHGPNGRP